MAEKDTMTRKWQITINNPKDKGMTHEYIAQKVGEMKNVIYWCMADEIGEWGTYHTHIYLAGKNGIRFSTIKKRFDGGHFEMAKGTSQQNKEYVSKTGKWLNDRKHETCVDGTFEEFGECPVERQGCRNDLTDLYAMIKDGMSNYEIMEQNPAFMLNLDKIERARQVVNEERYKHEFRQLDVTYIYGTTGAGKTRSVMERYGYESVFRVTDYLHPFDNYKGQDVIIFEEFRSSVRIGDMLNFLDGYPLELPCRYANKVACYTKVYVITNIPLTEQYTQLQREQPETWCALLRRFHHVIHYTSHDILKHNIHFIGDGFVELLDDENQPFDKVQISSIAG